MRTSTPDAITESSVTTSAHGTRAAIGKVPVLVMGMGIDLYGKERRVIRMVSRMPRLAPMFLLSKWDRGHVVSELNKLNIPWRKASFGYLGFARPQWTLINVSLMPSLFWKVLRAWKEHRARVLLFVEVLSFVNALPVFLALKAFTRTRIVFYLGDIAGGTRVQRFILKLVDRFADSVIVNSHTVRDGLRRSGVKRSAIHVVHNGVDPDAFERCTPSDRREFSDWKDDDIIVGFVGQLTENKGISDFLEAARLARRQNANIRFLVLGECPQAAGYIEDLQRNYADLKDSVRFLGFVPDVRPYYQVMNVVVVPSRHIDPAPNVNLEAMASGLPVIATAIGGNPELIDDGTTGFLVPPCRPDAIAATLLRLAEDRGLADRMGQAGQRRVREMFEANTNAAIVESLILGEEATLPNKAQSTTPNARPI